MATSLPPIRSAPRLSGSTTSEPFITQPPRKRAQTSHDFRRASAAPGSSTEADAVLDAKEQEQEARQRLIRAHRALHRVSSPARRDASRARKAEHAANVRHALKSLKGRTVVDELECLEEASAEEVREMSQKLNKAMVQVFLDGPSWYKLFKLVDANGSGRITIDEFQWTVRENLKLPPSKLSQSRLHALWKALDTDQSGWISAAEFGKFMRLGAVPSPALAVRKEFLARQRQEKLKSMAVEEQLHKNAATASYAASAKALALEARRIEELAEMRPAQLPPRLQVRVTVANPKFETPADWGLAQLPIIA